MQDMIAARLKWHVFVKPQKVWLDTKSRQCNGVLGSSELGVPAGKLYHIAGKKHGGKTALVAYLSGLAQQLHNAFVIWVDVENSYDKIWMKKLGLNVSPDNFFLIYPKILSQTTQRKSGKKVTKAGTSFLQPAQFLFREAEEAMRVVKENDPHRPLVLVVDSVANLKTELSIALGIDNQNMRSKLDRSMMLSDVLPTLCHYAKNYSMWVFLVNQVRVNPMKLFGDNEYSPGGNALDHNAHVMVKVKRTGDDVEDDSSPYISGIMQNVKNKAGGGSMEGRSCRYRIDFRMPNGQLWSFESTENGKKKRRKHGNATRKFRTGKDHNTGKTGRRIAARP